MKKDKLRISVLCGGQSVEHEISILSARNIVVELLAAQYHVDVFYISQQGEWSHLPARKFLAAELKKLLNSEEAEPVFLVPGRPGQPWFKVRSQEFLSTDCVFPVLHGTCGEDGTMQGLLDILGLPYVGCDVLASALSMKKHITKRLLREAGIFTADWVTLDKRKKNEYSYSSISRQLGPVLFVKPVSLGSSVGINKVEDQASFDYALQEAFRYDTKILVEKYIAGREIEVSVLGNEFPVASVPGEIVTSHGAHEFYSYDAKYLDPNGAQTITPANLPVDLVKLLKEEAIKTYLTLECSGMARIDFFVTPAQGLFVNEVNPIPGFTDISMYPKNWEASGLDKTALLEKLIQLALERYQQAQSFSHERAAVHENVGSEATIDQ